jgi:hypothetical protein
MTRLPSPPVLSLSKDAGAALAWFDRLTTIGPGVAMVMFGGES